jgi:hypothetical protein
MEEKVALDRGRRLIYPQPGYVLSCRVHAVAATSIIQQPQPGNTLYVNVCSHSAVEAPMLANGQSAPSEEAGGRYLPPSELANLNISISVGPVRPVRGSG